MDCSDFWPFFESLWRRAPESPLSLDAQIANRNRYDFKSRRFEIAEHQRNLYQNRVYIQGAAKGGRQKEFDHFVFVFGTLSVASVTLFVTFFLPNSFCWTPFAAGWYICVEKRAEIANEIAVIRIAAISDPLKTPTFLNKDVRPFFLSNDSIWSLPSVFFLSDYSIWRSWRLL